MTIDKLMDSNNDLKDKLEISNQNYNRVMNEQKDLEIKLNNLVETLNKYQEIFKNFDNKSENNNYNNSINSYNNLKSKNFENSIISNKSYRNYYPYRNNFLRNDYLSENIERNCKSPEFMNKRINHKFIYNNNYLLK